MLAPQLKPLLLLLWLACSFPQTCFSDTTKLQPSSWPEVKKAGKGKIVIYWFHSQPFIYRNEKGELSGIEYEFMEGFVKYLNKKYNVDISTEWIETNMFSVAYDTIKLHKREGTFGSSFFSITEGRKKEVDFAPSYLADISVLVSSYNVPVVGSVEEFNAVFSKLTALTIQKTTYEDDIIKLKKSAKLGFDIEYIPSSENIMFKLAASDSMFGFVDLPVYMMHFKNNPSLKVRRQNLFPIIREGYAIILPKGGSWLEPINEYFSDPDFLAHREEVISAYIDPKLYRMVEDLSVNANDPISLLTREKEIQFMDILNKRNQLEEETEIRYQLIVFLAITVLSLAIILVLYRKQRAQQKKIRSQNKHLLELDEEKNTLIKILAHDLRAPINHMQGLAQVLLMTNQVNDDQKEIVSNIDQSAKRLNKMILNILDVDAVEHNRTKVSLEKVLVNDLVKKVVDSFKSEAGQKQISLSYASADSDKIILADPLFLTQVFENLISNALKFSEIGKNVSVSIVENGDNVQIQVKDEGPGITDADLPFLFMKFKKLSARPTSGESSIGLGLSIVKKYVELMHGKVWCESEAGKGATFIVEFSKS